jgi:hypothetical protein
VADHLRRIEKGEDGESEREGRTEMITASLLFALIPAIGFGALYAYFSGIKAEGSPVGIAVAFGAVVIMPMLWYEKKRIGQATSCLPLEIDAIESLTCFLMSLALLASLLINYLWKIAWIDYLATAAILIFVAKEALESVSEMREDKDPPPNHSSGDEGVIATFSHPCSVSHTTLGRPWTSHDQITSRPLTHF